MKTRVRWSVKRSNLSKLLNNWFLQDIRSTNNTKIQQQMDKTRWNKARLLLEKIPKNLCCHLSKDLYKHMPNSVVMSRRTINRLQELHFCLDKPNRRQDRVKLICEVVMDSWSDVKMTVLRVCRLSHIACASRSRAIIILPSAISSTARFCALTSIQVRWIVLKTSSKPMRTEGRMVSNICCNQLKAYKNCKRKLVQSEKVKSAVHEKMI